MLSSPISFRGIAKTVKDFWNSDGFIAVYFIMKTYREDLRKRVMRAVDRGDKQCLIAKRQQNLC